MAQTTPTPEPQPKQNPSLMQAEMDGITSVRQFFSILFGRRKKPSK
jgi:hypothetical protein